MADWHTLLTHVPGCHAPCDFAQSAVQKVDHHFLAAAIYLIIIVLARVTVLEKQYFYQLFYRLRRHGMDTNAAENVHRFTLAIFLTNGILHAARLTDLHFLTATPLQWFSRITVFQFLYLLANVSLWLWAIKLYNDDVDSEKESYAPLEERKDRLIAYFGPVFILFVFEDGFSLYWEHFATSNVLEYFLSKFQALNGLSMIVALVSLALMLFATTMVAIFRRDWFVGFAWGVVLRALRFYLPIIGLLVMGIPALAFFVSGRNGNVASGSMQSPAAVQNVAPSQSAAPMQSASPAQGTTQTQSSPPVLSPAPTQSTAPAQGATPAQGAAPTQGASPGQRAPPVKKGNSREKGRRQALFFD
jgi:hypothetical protein